MNERPDRIRVLLVEHNRVLLEGLSHLVSDLPDVELAGAVSSASAALTLFEQQRPSVTVIDLELPDTAAGLVRQIRQRETGTSILILATYELDPAGAEAIASGAAAVIAKDQIASRLVPLIRSLAMRSEQS